MPKLLLPLVAMALLSGAALLAPRAEATLSRAPWVGEASAVEQVAARCVSKKICSPGRGCHSKTVCKRLPSKVNPTKSGPAKSGPGTM